MGTGSNLVIQNVGDVGRVQETMQKSAEIHQYAAGHETMLQAQIARKQVLENDNTSANNRLDKERQKEDKKKQNKKDGTAAHAGKNGLLNITV
jgi:hypothetical protein